MVRRLPRSRGGRGTRGARVWPDTSEVEGDLEKMRSPLLAASLTCLWCLSAPAIAQQWATAQRINSPDEKAVKNPVIYPDPVAGIHIHYKPTSPGWSVRYRRLLNGILSPPSIVPITGWPGGRSDIAVAGNGDIWIAWENWVDDAQGGEQIWAARSSNGGASWTTFPVTAYAYPPGDGGQAKTPQLAPFGASNSPNMLCASWRAKENRLYYGTWNGFSWSPHTSMGTWTDNFYAAVGACRNPADGSVYRTYGIKTGPSFQIAMRRFDGVNWGPETVVSTNTGTEFVARPSIAINNQGEIMVAWDQNEMIYARHYSPVTGWGPQIAVAPGFAPAVAAMQHSYFYLIYCDVGPDSGRVLGKRFAHGQWQPGASVVSVGLPYAFTVDPDLCVDSTNTLHAVWEYWGGDNAPHAYYSTLPHPTGPPAPAEGLTATSSDRINRIRWSNPQSINLHRVVVRYSTSGFPATPSQGLPLYDALVHPGTAGAVDHTGLTNGVTYYYSVFCLDAFGNSQPPATASATPFSQNCGSIRLLADGTRVDLAGRIITAVFPSDGVIYVQDPERSSGIRVVTATAGLAVGDVVNVSGVMGSRVVSGLKCERQVSSATVTVTARGNTVRPLMMKGIAAGGGSTPPWLLGVNDGYGVNTIGLLVAVAGRVTAKAGNFLFVDDGSGVLDTSGRTGVMVRCPDTSIPANVGDTVSAVGVMEGSVPTGWTTNRRLVRLRNYADLRVLTSP